MSMRKIAGISLGIVSLLLVAAAGLAIWRFSPQPQAFSSWDTVIAALPTWEKLFWKFLYAALMLVIGTNIMQQGLFMRCAAKKKPTWSDDPIPLVAILGELRTFLPQWWKLEDTDITLPAEAASAPSKGVKAYCKRRRAERAIRNAQMEALLRQHPMLDAHFDGFTHFCIGLWFSIIAAAHIIDNAVHVFCLAGPTPVTIPEEPFWTPGILQCVYLLLLPAILLQLYHHLMCLDAADVKPAGE